MRSMRLGPSSGSTRLTYLVALVAFLIHFCVDTCSAITCYYCSIQPPSGRSNQTAKLCSMFDRSTHFHIDCPYSTFCIKRTFELTLQQGKTVRVSERGCAPQRSNEHVLRDGRWQSQDRIEDDIYTAGCSLQEGLGLRVPDTEYCYCSSHLCNGSIPRLTNSVPLILVLSSLVSLRLCQRL